MIYVVAKDLATLAVGPFESQEDAEDHIAFCKARGDSASHEIIEVSITFGWKQIKAAHGIQMVISPEKDRAFKPIS